MYFFSSSTAGIGSEVLTPFRSVRMFFYLAFIASGSLGGLIALTQLIGALANASRSSKVPDIFTSLEVDFGAVAIFAFLYSRESNAKNAQLARLSREQSLSNLKIRVDENRIVSAEEKKRKRSITAILSIDQRSIKKGNFLRSPIDPSIEERRSDRR